MWNQKCGGWLYNEEHSKVLRVSKFVLISKQLYWDLTWELEMFIFWSQILLLLQQKWSVLDLLSYRVTTPEWVAASRFYFLLLTFLENASYCCGCKLIWQVLLLSFLWYILKCWLNRTKHLILTLCVEKFTGRTYSLLTYTLLINSLDGNLLFKFFLKFFQPDFFKL